MFTESATIFGTAILRKNYEFRGFRQNITELRRLIDDSLSYQWFYSKFLQIKLLTVRFQF